MGSITTAMCTSFKKELPQALHNFVLTTGHVFKVALLKAVASLAGNIGAATTNYSDLGADELATTGGYTQPGFAFTAGQNITPLSSGTTAYWSWSVNPSWSAATFTTSGCLLYNSSASDKAVAAFSFGGDQTIAAGTFTITLPTNDATNAILRLA